MMRLMFWSILCIVAAVMLILVAGPRSAAGARAKRVIAFRKGSTFFYRLNYKINAINTTTIFAQATGFKVAWQLPSRNGGPRSRRSVEDVHESARLVYESHGFDGESCLAKHVCQAVRYAEGRDGTIAKILRLLSGKTTDDSFDPLHCERRRFSCPLELVGVDTFIDHQ